MQSETSQREDDLLCLTCKLSGINYEMGARYTESWTAKVSSQRQIDPGACCRCRPDSPTPAIHDTNCAHQRLNLIYVGTSVISSSFEINATFTSYCLTPNHSLKVIGPLIWHFPRYFEINRFNKGFKNKRLEKARIKTFFLWLEMQ